ncbi:uncharacterized protein PV09_01814 [Verruconis gallopava]|uniref:SPT2 chromatin protein n=1 Tax=Verruconis gallopava TaxID=253628 RepID=A0A0D2B9J3_9PEZI|nr:uncharacterized protein PV09_01814 [Verruconis gallopava]KIW07904.1 hypothetical protein PV09_01814 [Verruconis gallopava]
MSYLSSILDSIGGDGTTAPPASTPAPRAPPTIQKRKADNELTNGPAKRPITPANAQNGNVQRPNALDRSQNGTSSKPTSASPAKGGLNSGSATTSTNEATKKPSSKAQTPSLGSDAAAKPNPKPTTSTTTTTKPATPTTEKPPPKKGSYADIIARAKAAQALKGPVGVIMHKQAEKVDPKARKAEAAKARGELSRGKRVSEKVGDRSRTGSAEAVSRSGEKIKQRQKPQEKSSYKGTAQPTTPIYTGSARPGQSSRTKAKRYDGYAGTDEEIDDYDEEDVYGYDDDESDMEAGAEDVWAEEEEALRQAKKDDAAELAYEIKLKREKEARKRKALEELAASRRKR